MGICAFSFVLPLTANLRWSMDQFRKKTINEEGKKKEGEENFVRNFWEENTGVQQHFQTGNSSAFSDHRWHLNACLTFLTL
jgi:hypothetical protein